MQFTDAEIKQIARQRSGGCSTKYNQIKRELEIYNESVSTDPEPEDPPDVTYAPIPEVIFVRKFFAWSFSIMFVLIMACVVYASIVEAM